MLGDGISTVAFTLGDGATAVSARAGRRSPGLRSTVTILDGRSGPGAAAAESTTTVLARELPGGTLLVSPAPGSRGSLIERLRLGFVVSALTAASGENST
jgi:hypothetical protein